MNKQSFSSNKITAPNRQYQDMRDAFFEELFQIAVSDRDVILLTADQGSATFKKFEEKIPEQLINVGISEQNMISLAAGLALSRKKVFVHAIANFTTLRCYEQIKVDLSVMELPVTIAGIGAGFTYGSDGPTHHANQDIAVMRAIPGIRILNASDCIDLSVFPHIAYRIPKLTYIRFEKGNFKALYNKRHNFLDGMHEVLKGDDSVIISTGVMVHQALNIAKKIKLKIGLINIYQLKPLNEKKLLRILSKYNNIIVLEEHLSYGGLATIIADFLADQCMSKKFLRIGLPDKNLLVYGDRNHMHQKVGIALQQVFKTVNQFLKNQ